MERRGVLKGMLAVAAGAVAGVFGRSSDAGGTPVTPCEGGAPAFDAMTELKKMVRPLAEEETRIAVINGIAPPPSGELTIQNLPETLTAGGYERDSTPCEFRFDFEFEVSPPCLEIEPEPPHHAPSPTLVDRLQTSRDWNETVFTSSAVRGRDGEAMAEDPKGTYDSIRKKYYGKTNPAFGETLVEAGALGYSWHPDYPNKLAAAMAGVEAKWREAAKGFVPSRGGREVYDDVTTFTLQHGDQKLINTNHWYHAIAHYPED